MFSTSFHKNCCSFAENIIFGKIQNNGQVGGHAVKQLLP